MKYPNPSNPSGHILEPCGHVVGYTLGQMADWGRQGAQQSQVILLFMLDRLDSKQTSKSPFERKAL